MSDLLYVLAGNYDQARQFARSVGSQAKTVNVDNPDKLIGQTGGKLFIVGTAPQRSNFRAILEMAALRRFTVEYV